MTHRSILHVFATMNGHVLSDNSKDCHDCWCEPTIHHTFDKYGRPCVIVEHNDFDMRDRSDQLAEQEAGIPASLAWINNVLYRTDTYPTSYSRDIGGNPPQLPPHHEGEE